MSGYRKIVTELVRDGYVFVRINSVLVSDAQAALKKFLQSLGDNFEQWALTREGESEADVGVISKLKQGGFDEKMYVHFAHDLPVILEKAGIKETKQQRACLTLIERLYQELKDMALGVIDELDRKKLLVEGDFLRIVKNTFKLPKPHNVSVLRYLNYPDTPDYTAAKEHFDKSFLTIHLGDESGELYIVDKDEQWKSVSPPQGMALLFFGVKALYASKGLISPLRHKSVTTPGQARTAMVMFVHADVGREIADAGEAYAAFYR